MENDELESLELTYLEGIIGEFNKRGIGLYLYKFNDDRIEYGFYNGSRSVRYSENLDLDNPHEFRINLLRELDEFVSDWR